MGKIVDSIVNGYILKTIRYKNIGASESHMYCYMYKQSLCHIKTGHLSHPNPSGIGNDNYLKNSWDPDPYIRCCSLCHGASNGM